MFLTPRYGENAGVWDRNFGSGPTFFRRRFELRSYPRDGLNLTPKLDPRMGCLGAPDGGVWRLRIGSIGGSGLTLGELEIYPPSDPGSPLLLMYTVELD
jgi:hypothetical protein